MAARRGQPANIIEVILSPLKGYNEWAASIHQQDSAEFSNWAKGDGYLDFAGGMSYIMMGPMPGPVTTARFPVVRSVRMEPSSEHTQMLPPGRR